MLSIVSSVLKSAPKRKARQGAGLRFMHSKARRRGLGAIEALRQAPYSEARGERLLHFTCISLQRLMWFFVWIPTWNKISYIIK